MGSAVESAVIAIAFALIIKRKKKNVKEKNNNSVEAMVTQWRTEYLLNEFRLEDHFGYQK